MIVDEAMMLNYGEIMIKGWRGQDSYGEKGMLNFIEATESAIALFKNLEENEYEYDVIYRSFGSGVFLNMCLRMELTHIGFASLWGIPYYSRLYELFKVTVHNTMSSSKNKGVNIVNVSDDNYSLPTYNQFLKNSTKNMWS